MKFSRVLIFIGSLVFINNIYATTWYLDKDDILRNDDIPELTIHNKNGVLLFYKNNNKLPVFKINKLVKISSSAALVDSLSYDGQICVEVFKDSNGSAQKIRNMYIIADNKVRAFRTNNSNITCESELKITHSTIL